MKYLLLFLLITNAAWSQSSSLDKNSASQSEWTKKSAKHWFNEKAWLNGWSVSPSKTIDQLEFAKQYHANQSRWDKAFKFLDTADLINIKPGRYPIDGDNVYATVTEGPTKDMDKSSWEAHKNYADIQYVISGREKIGRAAFSTATVKVPYDPAKDIAFYDAPGKFYVADPDAFFVFFPEHDAHRPGLKIEGFDTDKKIVVKVRTAN
jgi:YhcH/YjgK/YiaL family protein